MTALSRGAFRSLRNHNYRIWAVGALVSNVGTWMQRTAQDWLVLTAADRTTTPPRSAWSWRCSSGRSCCCCRCTGYAADHFDRRKLLLATQAAMGAAGRWASAFSP